MDKFSVIVLLWGNDRNGKMRHIASNWRGIILLCACNQYTLESTLHAQHAAIVMKTNETWLCNNEIIAHNCLGLAHKNITSLMKHN